MSRNDPMSLTTRGPLIPENGGSGEEEPREQSVSWWMPQPPAADNLDAEDSYEPAAAAAQHSRNGAGAFFAPLLPQHPLAVTHPPPQRKQRSLQREQQLPPLQLLQKARQDLFDSRKARFLSVPFRQRREAQQQHLQEQLAAQHGHVMPSVAKHGGTGLRRPYTPLRPLPLPPPAPPASLPPNKRRRRRRRRRRPARYSFDTHGPRSYGAADVKAVRKLQRFYRALMKGRKIFFIARLAKQHRAARMIQRRVRLRGEMLLYTAVRMKMQLAAAQTRLACQMRMRWSMKELTFRRQRRVSSLEHWDRVRLARIDYTRALHRISAVCSAHPRAHTPSTLAHNACSAPALPVHSCPSHV